MSGKKIVLWAVITILGAGIGYLALQPSDITPPETPEPQMTIEVYFGNIELNPNMEDCGEVFPVEREIPETRAVATAALNELFRGPTEQEKEQGYVSFFSWETRNILKNVRIEEGTAYLNLEDLRTLVPGANSSCGSEQLRSQIEQTLKQFPTVDRVVYAINDSPRTFYEWIQVGCTEENNYCNPTPFVGQGFVEGSLGYPSEEVPADIEVCAETLDGEQRYCTQDKTEAEKYVYGIGYQLEVPAGDYYVSASRPQAGGFKGYYTEYVRCGMEQSCLSHKPIEVRVEQNRTTENIDLLDWRAFPENIKVEEKEEINLVSPKPYERVEMPLEIKGQARGTWFFEASFPLKLVDRSGNILLSSYIMTDEEWMTEELIEFEAEITSDRVIEGTVLSYLILEKANPSGLPENADQLSIPIYLVTR